MVQLFNVVKVYKPIDYGLAFFKRSVPRNEWNTAEQVEHLEHHNS
jgi:hypothetical protein